MKVSAGCVPKGRVLLLPSVWGVPGFVASRQPLHGSSCVCRHTVPLTGTPVR